MQEVEYFLDRLRAMVESADEHRSQYGAPSSQSIRIINAYGDAIKRKFKDEKTKKSVGVLLRIANDDDY